MSENDVKTAIIGFLADSGWLVLRINSGRDSRRFFYYARWFVAGSGPQAAGILDILGLHLAHPPLMVDAKAPGKIDDVSAAQRRFMTEWRKRGGLAIVADSLDGFIRELEGYNVGPMV